MTKVKPEGKNTHKLYKPRKHKNKLTQAKILTILILGERK